MRTAFGAARTRVVIHAWINTLRVLALLVRWTVAVTTATDYVTTLVRVSTVAAATSALGLIARHVALAVLTARIVDQARVHAHAVDARLVAITLGVRSTADSAASSLGVTFVARLTTANRAMVVDVALGVQTTIAWVAALSVDTRLGLGAFRVALAAWLALQYDLVAVSVDVGYP